MKLIPDLREFVGLLNSESVRYLVIGGWAYNRYAEPRFTGDIDFFVATDDINQARLVHVLERFGLGDVLKQRGGGPLFQKKVMMIGRPPNRIDLLTEISGVDFEAAWEDRVAGELDGLQVDFISLQDLVRNKRAAGRPKDLADLYALEQVSGSPE